MSFKTAFVLLIVTLSFIDCSNQKIESIKPDSKILIDGIGNDWDKYNLIFNKDFNIVFGALNTDSSLYIMFRFNNPALARKCSLNGLTLWLDEEKKTGINYQDYTLTDMLLNSDPRELMNWPDNRGVFIPGGSFSLINEDRTWESELIPAFDLNAQFELVNGLYCFEFSIPLLARTDKINLSGKKMIPLGVELSAVSDEIKNALKKKRDQRMQSWPSGNDARGGSMRGGGKRGGGRGGNRKRTDRPNMDFDGKEIWFDIILEK